MVAVDDLTRLAVAAAAGDRVALTAFVRQGQGEVWRLCSYLVGADQADDCTQDALLRAIKALPDFRGESSARTWLLSITRHTCVDSIRRSMRQRRLTERLAQRRPRAEADHAGLTELDALVAELGDDRRSAFVLTQVLGLSYAETAEICDCPVGTVRSRVARAREDLLGAIDAGTGADDGDGDERRAALGD
jgi:RNA polymerase sigma-70 factor (ECF subfamily)